MLILLILLMLLETVTKSNHSELIALGEEIQKRILLEQMIETYYSVPTESTLINIEETQAPTTQYVEPETQAPIRQAVSSCKFYSVNGITMEFELQRYLYDKLCSFGISWYYEYALCQIYQESNFNRYSDNGRDKGLCQQKAIYWDSRAASSGIPGADIWDPYAQIHVYVWMMSGYLASSGYDVKIALSMYYLGYYGWSDEYIYHVTRWMDYLKEVY